MDLLTKAKQLMHQQTVKNGAPAWKLTEIAIDKGRELAKRYKVDQELVLASLYLAHTVFSEVIAGRIQKNHEKLSARFAMKYLKTWRISPEKTKIIINSILAHHDKVKAESLEAEVMKNAECYKFITIEGALAYLHELGRRQMDFDSALKQVRYKAKQKLSYISLPAVKRDAQKNYHDLMLLLDTL